MSQVLIDTSVWRGHFAGRLNPVQSGWLAALFDEDGAIVTHPWVLGELVLGGLAEREEALLDLLPSVLVLEHGEVLGFARHRRLTRRGIGWVDVHLLASALASSAQLWSQDKDLQAAARELGVLFQGAT